MTSTVDELFWDALTIKADWLEERGDPRAAGYRWAAFTRRIPECVSQYPQYALNERWRWRCRDHSNVVGARPCANSFVPRAWYEQGAPNAVVWDEGYCVGLVFGSMEEAYDWLAERYVNYAAIRN